MKLKLIYTENLEQKEIDLTGVLELVVEIGNDRWTIDEYAGGGLDVRSIGRQHQVMIEPVASNAIRLHTAP